MIAALCIPAAAASAQSASAQAQSLFDQGRRLMNDGKTAEGCAALESSEKLDPEIITLLNLGECRERNHQLATAWAAFIDASRMAQAVDDRKLSRVARSHADRLQPRLSYLTVVVAPDRQINGLEISRGEDVVDPMSWNHALPIDGGRYVITARAPGRAAWSTKVVILDHTDRQIIEIPALEMAPRPIATALSAPPPAAPNASLVAPIAVGVSAATLTTLAIGFEISAAEFYDQSNASMVQSQRDQLKRSADDRRYLAEAFGGAAIVGAGVAIYLYVRRSDGVAVTPLASSRVTGVVMTVSW